MISQLINYTATYIYVYMEAQLHIFYGGLSMENRRTYIRELVNGGYYEDVWKPRTKT